jgi:glutamate dehydrogenase
LQERRASNKGLTRPELSVLVSYVKAQLKEELVISTVPDDVYMLNSVEDAFPQRLREQFNDKVHEHRLRKEIISNQLANDLVNHMGITFVDRMSQSTGVDSSVVMRAYVSAREVFDMSGLWKQIEQLDYQISSEVQMELMSELMHLVRRGTRWFIRNRRGIIEPAVEIENFKKTVELLRDALPNIIHGDMQNVRYESCQRYIEMGVPEELASCLASVRELYPFLGIIEAAGVIKAPAEKVAELFFSLSEKLQLDWFDRQITQLKVENYWQAMARETYRDDLEWQLRTLTEGAMRHMCEKGEVKACVERWMDQQEIMVSRWKSLVTQLQATSVHEFAMYSVAIRELLDMAQSSKYVEVGEVG